MSDYRIVHCRIWSDSWFMQLSRDEQLVFFLLLTHPNMKAFGCMRATVAGLAAEIGLDTDTMRDHMRRMSEAGKVIFNEKAFFVGLPAFLKHNKPRNPNNVKGWEKHVSEIPECPERDHYFWIAETHVKQLGEQFREQLPELFIERSQAYCDLVPETTSNYSPGCPNGNPDATPSGPDLDQSKADIDPEKTGCETVTGTVPQTVSTLLPGLPLATDTDTDSDTNTPPIGGERARENPKKSKPSKRETEWIKDAWNEHAHEKLPRCVVWSDERHKAYLRLIGGKWPEDFDPCTPGGWIAAIKKINQSSLCRGERGSDWKANIDFLLNMTKAKAYAKVIEDAYSDGKPNKALHSQGAGKPISRVGGGDDLPF